MGRWLRQSTQALMACCWLVTSVRGESPLSLEDSVGQLMLIWMYGESLTPEMEHCLDRVRPGGVIYYDWCNGLTSPQQVRALSQGLQMAAQKRGMPTLWICTDQEGGRVMRLRKGGYTHFPSAMALGAAGDLKLTQEIGRAIAQELAYSGINVNFGPVVDIYSDSDSTIIGNRCFANKAQDVALQAGAWLKGLQSAGVKGCIKHFPGHGAASIDTHDGLAHVDLSKERLESVELVPYKALAHESYAVMTAHILVPSLDEKAIATKSSKILQGLLKEKLGFEGIIFADSLVMGAATPEDGDIVQTSIEALMAGSDVLMYGGKVLVGSAMRELTPEDLFRIKAQLVERAQKDPHFCSRVYEAAEKIVRYKQQLASDSEAQLQTQEHELLARQVAALAVKWTSGGLTLGASDESVMAAASPLISQDLASWMSAQGCRWSVFNWQEAKKQIEEGSKAKTLVLYSYEAWKDAGQKSLLELAQSKGWQVVVLALGTPSDLSFFEVPAAMQVSSPDPYCLERAWRLLTHQE